MSLRVGLVADPSVCAGFRLAGLETRPVSSREEGLAALEEMGTGAEWGVVLVQEEVMPDAVPRGLRRSRTGIPVIVPFPGPAREGLPGEAEAYVTELLRQAVGYRVRLR